jgi:hypothetical protein
MANNEQQPIVIKTFKVALKDGSTTEAVLDLSADQLNLNIKGQNYTLTEIVNGLFWEELDLSL